eukprot:9396159-Lingulodinium_polyedra.AAC.1
MLPPQSAPGDSPEGWASDDPDSDYSAGGPLPPALRAWRGASSNASDSDSGSDSDWHDGDPPATAPCSALQEGSGGSGASGVDAPRRGKVAGGQHGL